MKLAGKTVEWLYSNDCAILPFRWTNVSSCQGSFPEPGDGYSPDNSSNICFGSEARIDGRSTSLTSLKAQIGDEIDDETCGNLREATSKDEGASNIVNKKAEPECRSGEYPQDQPGRVTKQKTPLNPTGAVTGRVEHWNWQEEKKQWMSAAGVRTPAELERKLADMYRIAAQNEAAVKNFTEVKTFLQQLQQLDKSIAKRKKRPDQRSRRRKRSRTGFVVVDTEDSSTEGLKVGSLLDPQIMRSFGNLIKSSA